VRKHIYDAFMNGPEHVIELFHGYTYSGHPLACAASIATLDLYRDEALFERARAMEPTWADAVMSLKGKPGVLDIRQVGLVAAFDMAPSSEGVGKRGYQAMETGFHDEDIMFRATGDTIAVSPPLIINESQIGELVEKVGRVIDRVM